MNSRDRKILRLEKELEKVRVSRRQTYNRVHRRLQYHRDKAKELREVIKDLKREIVNLKRQKPPRPKIVKYRKINRVTRVNCKGCKRYERFMGRPMDGKYRRVADMMKYSIAADNVLSEEDVNRSEYLTMCFAYMCEYILRRDVPRVCGIGKHQALASLNRLKDKGYLSTSDIVATEQKRVSYHYFLTVLGKEKVESIANKISRRHLVLL